METDELVCSSVHPKSPERAKSVPAFEKLLRQNRIVFTFHRVYDTQRTFIRESLLVASTADSGVAVPEVHNSYEDGGNLLSVPLHPVRSDKPIRI